MRGTSSLTSAALGGLMLLGITGISSAQGAGTQLVARMASVAPGSIQGVVNDDTGSPIADAVVSAIGTTTLYAVTDSKGRFELRALPPGSYFVQAHLSGYVVPHAQLVEVRTNARTASVIALRRLDAVPILAAGVGTSGRARPVLRMRRPLWIRPTTRTAKVLQILAKLHGDCVTRVAAF